MNVKDGWTPLCGIVGKPVPKGSFPHANESAAVVEIMPWAVTKTFRV